MAILGALRAPDAAFASVIRTHFKLKRTRVLRTLDLWIEELQTTKDHSIEGNRDRLQLRAFSLVGCPPGMPTIDSNLVNPTIDDTRTLSTYLQHVKALIGDEIAKL